MEYPSVGDGPMGVGVGSVDPKCGLSGLTRECLRDISASATSWPFFCPLKDAVNSLETKKN